MNPNIRKHTTKQTRAKKKEIAGDQYLSYVESIQLGQQKIDSLALTKEQILSNFKRS